MTRSGLLLLLSLSMLPGCDRTPDFVEARSGDGKRYRDTLVSLIRNSDQIVVLEHSYPFDFEAKPNEPVPKQLIYSRVVLTETQMEMFLATMEALDAKTQTGFPACIIEPHHTIDFFAGSKLTSTMNICFKCNQVSWDATTATPPEGLYEGLRIFIKAIGMQPSRDWKLLASERQPE